MRNPLALLVVKLSLSARRAWIEIPTAPYSVRTAAGRSPHGERGLKFLKMAIMVIFIGSLSARRAWIEIAKKIFGEILYFGRSPHGERGLK